MPTTALADAPEPVLVDAIYHWLDSHGVKYKQAASHPIAMIDEDKSRMNQARAEAIDPDVVDRYTAALRHGDKFPPIVAIKMGGKFRIIDGNHRDKSRRKAGFKDIDVIEIDADTPSEVVYMLTVEANTRHGAPTTNAWRAQQSVHLHKLGYPADRIAEALGITKSSVHAAVRANEATKRATEMKLRRFGELAPSQKDKMANIKSDAVFRAVYELAVQTEFRSGRDWASFIRDVNKAKSEGEALELIGEVHEQREFDMRQAKATGAKSTVPSPKMRILTAIGAVSALDPEDVDEFFITDNERSEVGDRVAHAAIVLMELEERLRR